MARRDREKLEHHEEVRGAMSMELWDPFSHAMSLRDAMDRLMQESFIRPSGGLRGMNAGSLSLDVHEDADAYTVRASLPGIKPEDVQVQVMGDTITIRGETHEEHEQKSGERALLRERHAGSFSRTVTLPMPIDGEHAEASFENGVLTLSLPKEPQARPRRIQVRGTSTGRDQVTIEDGSRKQSTTSSSAQSQPNPNDDVQSEATAH